jgi:hypothetical protein
VKASLKRVSSWIQRGSSLVGSTTPTDSLAAGGEVGAVVSCGAVVGVAVAQAESTMAAMNKMDTNACSEFLLDTITPPNFVPIFLLIGLIFYEPVGLCDLLFYAGLLSSQQSHSKDIVFWLR